MVNKRKIVAISMLINSGVVLASYMIPDEVYTIWVAMLLFCVELLVLYARDLIVFWKRGCRFLQVGIAGMLSIYLLNITDLLFDIPRQDYLIISLGIIVACSATVFIYFKK